MRFIRKRKNWLFFALAVFLVIKLPQPYLKILAENEGISQEEETSQSEENRQNEDGDPIGGEGTEDGETPDSDAAVPGGDKSGENASDATASDKAEADATAGDATATEEENSDVAELAGDSSGEQNEIAVVSQAEETTAEPLDVTPYITKVQAWYRTEKSGDNWVEVGADTTGIPADAELKFTISYKNANAGDVEAHSRTLQYKLPDLLIEPHVELSVIQDANGKEIGTITADTSAKTIQMSFTDEFLKREEAEVKTIDGSFSFYAGADRDKVRENPNQNLIIGNMNISLPFETESDARLGTLNLTKTAGKFITDEAGVAYLEYTLTVSTGDTAMPEIKVTDHFTANAEYIEKYVGVTGTESGAGTNQDSSVAPYEVGSQAGNGKLYLGNTITEAAPIPEQAGASVTSPGVLVWNVGKMNAQENRSLVYRVKLKPEYTGAQSRGAITNAAASFAKSYPHQTVSTNFEPHTYVGIQKTGGKYTPNESGGGTITYQVTVSADETNTYPLKNVKINDALKDITDIRYLPYLHYAVESFQLYQGSQADESKRQNIGQNPHKDQSNPIIYDSHTEKRFDFYIDTLNPGETMTLIYQVEVSGDIFALGNETIRIKNRAAAYSDDTVTGGNQSFSFANVEKTLDKKVWDRKLQSEKTAEDKNVPLSEGAAVYRYQNASGSWVEATDAAASFTVPAGSFPYQVVVNEAADWDVASAVLTDTLKNEYLVYTGYLRVDYYESGLSVQPTSDAQAVELLKKTTATKTVWADIDKMSTFSFSPKELGLADGDVCKGAFLLTYYAKPNQVSNVSLVTTGNAFTVKGKVVGPGGISVTLAGVQVSTSTVLQGEKNLNLVKSGWYFDHNKESSGDWEHGRLYWVIDVTGTEISAGTQIKDVPSTDVGSLHQVRGTSMVGLYIGTIPDGKSFTDYYGSVRELEADKKMKKLSGNDKNGEILPADADYAWSAPADGTSATIEIKKTLTLQEGEHLYMVLQTRPTYNLNGTRAWRNYYNDLWFRESSTSEFMKVNRTVLRGASAGTNFKEMAGVYEYSGGSDWKVISNEKGNISQLLQDEITEPGTYVEWRIKINYAGDLEGTVHVEDQIPEGLTPVYARYFWIAKELFDNPPVVPEIGEYKNDQNWEKLETTALIDGNDRGNVERTCISYFNSETGQLQFRVENLRKGGESADQRSLEIQVLTRVSDPEILLNGKEKEFVNAITVKNDSDKVISNSSATVTVTKKTISKEMGSVDNSKLPFTLQVNSLGEDLVKGEDTLTLVDEMKDPLQFDTESLKVTDKDGNQVANILSRIEDTEDGQKLILTIPDGQALTITYDAILNSPPDQDISVNNAAYWWGQSSDIAQIKDATVRYTVSSTAETTTYPVLQVKKVDKDNTAAALNGAKFRLEQVAWNTEEKCWKKVENGTDIVGTTGSTGNPAGIFSFGNTDGTRLQYNTVYRLTEEEAPEGYVLDKTPQYYVVAKKVDDNYPPELEKWREWGAKLSYSGTTYYVTAYNEKGRLGLEKTFQNVNGETVTGSGLPDGSYRFGLYPYQESGSYDSTAALQLLEVICQNGNVTYKLNGSSTEKPEFTQVPVGAQYRVLELDSNGKPITSTGTVVTMTSGLKYRVEYESGADAVTISEDGTAEPVKITNRQYADMEPGTGIFTESNLIYGSLLGGIVIVGILFWISRRRRR